MLKGKFPRGFPIKKKGYRGLAADIKKIRELLEREGSCGYTRIQEITGIKRGTLGRRLNFMKDLGDIVRDEGRRYVLTTSLRTYSPQTYKVYLTHSRMLVRGILAVNGFLPQFLPRTDYFYMGDILTEQRRKLKLHGDPEMWQCALLHLKIGYPDIFSIFEKCESLLDRVQRVKMAEEGRAWEKCAGEIPDNQSAGVNEDLSAEEANNFEEESKGTPTLTEKERRELDEETSSARFELEDRLTKLIWKVRNGGLLRGRCNQCPEANISRELDSS